MIAPLRETPLDSTGDALDRARRWAAQLLHRPAEEGTTPKVARAKAWLFIGWVAAVFVGYAIVECWFVLAN